MGSCISKCSRKRKRHDGHDNVNSNSNSIVHDKHLMAVSMAPPAPLSPLAYSSSSSSVPSLSCSSTNQTTSSSPSMLSSSSRSYMHRSFSNDFLWSRVQQNPPVIHNIGHINKTVLLQKQDIPTKVDVSSTPNKRARFNSPDISRQKSFRRTLPDRTPMRSPSSGRSRRGLSNAAATESRFKHLVKKENIRPSCPNNNARSNGLGLMNRETCPHRIGSKIDEATAGKLISEREESKDVAMEDIDSPLIALDCFIFL